MTRAKPQPLEMFGAGDDLPLFSGAPQKTVVKEFKPQEQVRQPSMFAAACSVCFGTGEITTKTRSGKVKMVKCMYCSRV